MLCASFFSRRERRVKKRDVNIPDLARSSAPGFCLQKFAQRVNKKKMCVLPWTVYRDRKIDGYAVQSLLVFRAFSIQRVLHQLSTCHPNQIYACRLLEL